MKKLGAILVLIIPTGTALMIFGVIILIMCILLLLGSIIPGETYNKDYANSYNANVYELRAEFYVETSVNVPVPYIKAYDNYLKPEQTEELAIQYDDMYCFETNGVLVAPYQNTYPCLNIPVEDYPIIDGYYKLYSYFTDDVLLDGFYLPFYEGTYVKTADFGTYDGTSTAHYGVDLVNATDKKVYAIGNGTVVETYSECIPNSGYIGNSCGGYFGNHVIVKHIVGNDVYFSIYGHMNSINASVGDVVTPTTQVGVQGATGNVTGEHLHLELRKGENSSSNAVNPLLYLQVRTDESLNGSTISEEHIAMMTLAGIEKNDQQAANFIVDNESSWNYQATNTSSGAYGLCQALPGNKMADAGSDWETNTITQLRWCDSYAKERYESWQSAEAFWKENKYW